ncbi:ribosome biogenesis GTP-binding protein YihA/YsxC [Roseomonas elaeocarpi]|uniref:Probable GTP-binding protein EngB n=1 Tax=Roseomonas elaeocarpi TaxID=907779 RepID=A0ABV6JYL2_9PROT
MASSGAATWAEDDADDMATPPAKPAPRPAPPPRPAPVVEAPPPAPELLGGPADAAERRAWLEAGRLLFARPCRFTYASQRIDQLPAFTLPEVAFCGRSNVGKSSLVNALTGQKTLARVSNTPGRTKQLNFFELGEEGRGRLTLVDMPGYGYAQAAKQVKEDWQGLMFDYLRGRPNLMRVVLMLDARIETKASDLAAMDLLGEAAVPFQIVLTKADSAKPYWLRKRQEEVAGFVRERAAAHPVVVTTSSEDGTGIEELRAELAALAAPDPRLTGTEA